MKNDLVFLMSGSYGIKKELANKILEKDNSIRIVSDKEVERCIESGRTIEKIILDQQSKGIPTVIYAPYSLASIAEENKNVVHINIKEDEAKYKTDIPEYHFYNLITRDLDELVSNLVEIAKLYSTVKINEDESCLYAPIEISKD